MPKEPTRTPEEEGKRIGHLLLFMLAGAGFLRTEVLDKVEIDRDEIVNIADNIEKHVMVLAHLVLGANSDEWKEEPSRWNHSRI